jgi:hypothetical protein
VSDYYRELLAKEREQLAQALAALEAEREAHAAALAAERGRTWEAWRAWERAVLDLACDRDRERQRVHVATWRRVLCEATWRAREANREARALPPCSAERAAAVLTCQLWEKQRDEAAARLKELGYVEEGPLRAIG